MAAITYKKSGVDIEAGNLFVRRIKPLVKRTARTEVLSKIGHYAGLFRVDLKKYREPVMAASTDGVGTKLKLALDNGRLGGLGQDLVAMSANDLICLGAEPLFFLDYFATGKLNVKQATEVVGGIAKACEKIRCTLLGGETAEMPGLYQPGDFDLAGFVVGMVDKKKILDGARIRSGDVVIGLASSGFHSNGYSLVRKIVSARKLSLKKTYAPLKKSLGDALLEPTRLYVKTVLDLKEKFDLHGVAHITGGGLLENLPRLYSDSFQSILDRSAWPLPPLFRLFQEWGNIPDPELHRVFNCGIGLMLVVPPQQANRVLRYLKNRKEKAWAIGKIVRRPQGEAPIIIR